MSLAAASADGRSQPRAFNHESSFRSRLRHGARRCRRHSLRADFIRGVDRAHVASHRCLSAGAQRLRLSTARRVARRRGARGRSHRSRPGDGRAPRRARQCQRELRRPRPAVHVGDAAAEGREGTRTFGCRAPAARCRRRVARCDECAVSADGRPILQQDLRHLEQPVGSHADTWWIVGWVRRGARRRSGVLQHRVGHRRQH